MLIVVLWNVESVLTGLYVALELYYVTLELSEVGLKAPSLDCILL